LEHSDVNGWVVIDKPLGPNSHEITAWVRKIVGAKKAGHAGTLDPNASGVLPIAVGKATKLLIALSTSNKEYVALAEFEKPVDTDKFNRIYPEFVGKIWQMPPEMSAVKRRLRIRRVYNIDVLEIKDNLVLFKTKVQHGTYIRKLISDWGELMGNPGKMIELRRTQSGPFTLKDSVTMQDLVDAIDFEKQGIDYKRWLLPMERGVSHIKEVIVKDTSVSAICHGAMLTAPGVKRADPNIQPGDLVRIMTQKDELVGLGEAVVSGKTMMNTKHGFVVKTKSVVMDKDKYSKSWRKSNV
jgi:H/ACA ribonucleoprotein complex subunit 4